MLFCQSSNRMLRLWIKILDDFSISISTTSPSTISLSSLIRTPIDLRNACVNAYVLLISSENIYEPASIVNGTSSPRVLAIAIAIAVLPVPGWPPNNMALPAILPSLIISRIMPAAFLASVWPTIPIALCLGSKDSLMPRPRICEWAPTRSILVTSLTSATFGVTVAISNLFKNQFKKK